MTKSKIFNGNLSKLMPTRSERPAVEHRPSLNKLKLQFLLNQIANIIMGPLMLIKPITYHPSSRFKEDNYNTIKRNNLKGTSCNLWHNLIISSHLSSSSCCNNRQVYPRSFQVHRICSFNHQSMNLKTKPTTFKEFRNHQKGPEIG